MAVGTLSTEATIRRQLKELNCAENAFAVFNGVVGRTRFFEAMQGKPGKHFSHDDAERMLQVLEEMRELQSEIDLPIDWSQANKVETALVIRRVSKIAAELNDTTLNAAAAKATQSLK
jgi:predicted ArsR family transcriptional regulator